MKKCSKCKITKTLKEFQKSSHTKDKLQYKCKFCMNEYYQNHKNKILLRLKKYRNDNIDKVRSLERNSKFKARYSISSDFVDKMKINQQNQCKICKNIKFLHVDHCHKTGKIRGLLCYKCNHALGLLNDDPSLFLAAAQYLRGIL